MSDDDELKPHLRLTVENSQKDIDQDRANMELRRPLRELAANILRVVRGAGNSYEIAGQCVAVIEAFHRYREKVGHWPDIWDIGRCPGTGSREGLRS